MCGMNCEIVFDYWLLEKVSRIESGQLMDFCTRNALVGRLLCEVGMVEEEEFSTSEVREKVEV
jgi:hypothetical protein